MADESNSDHVSKFKIFFRKFRRACTQVIFLNNHISDGNIRIKRAKRNRQKGFVYALRLRVQTQERMRDKLHAYAYELAKDLNEIQAQIIRENAVNLQVVLAEIGLDNE